MLGGSEGVADLKVEAMAGFAKTFQEPCAAFGVAPGRAEVVGNHTDYNEGYILSCAVDRYVCMAGRATEGKASVASSSFEGVIEFDTSRPERQVDGKAWANYVLGVVDELNKLGMSIGGFNAYVTSDVPPGSGVSSSAALEMATAKLLQALFPDTVGKLDDIAVIKACKAAENNFVGMGCGILDQFSSGMGKSGKLLYLDCRDLSYKYVPFQGGAVFVLANTKAKHELVDGQYDKLRAACFESAEKFKTVLGRPLTHLRDVSVEDFEANKAQLTDAQMKRAKHIVYENDRVLRSFAALEQGDLAFLGQAMSASHDSSRDDFGNSCKELDVMRECAEGIDGWLGGRLMGGGFGGCTINLVKQEQVDAFCEELAKRYQAKTGIDPAMVQCKTGDGAFFDLAPAA